MGIRGKYYKYEALNAKLETNSKIQTTMFQIYNFLFVNYLEFRIYDFVFSIKMLKNKC